MVTVTMSRKMVTVTIFLAGAGLVGAGYVLGQQKQAPEVRRVVTKLDESGKAMVMFDSRLQLTAPRPPNYAANLWITDKSLPDFSWTDDRGKTKIGLVPPKSGSVFRVVDSAVHLEAGDVVVQQATNHAWVNRGKEPCRIAFLLIDSQEP
jgi:hypothetical protein